MTDAIARQFVQGNEVLDLLDYPGYFDLLGRPMPEDPESILADLESDRLIARDMGGKWNILNLGAILFANDLGRFESRLARKAIRFVAYDGDGRAAGSTRTAARGRRAVVAPEEGKDGEEHDQWRKEAQGRA